MKKTFRRVVSVLLAAAMAISMAFVGFASNYDEKNPNSVAEKEVSSNQAVSSESTPEKKGWVKTDDGHWMYYNDDGVAVTGWQGELPGWKGQWFHFDENGIMDTGWQANIPGWLGKWFFFDNTTGVMKKGWQNAITGWENKWFCFDDNGVMLTGKHLLSWSGGTNYFFFNGNGVMHTGWKFMSWFNGDNWVDNWFYFYTDTGAMAVNTTTPDGYYVDGNGVWRP